MKVTSLCLTVLLTFLSWTSWAKTLTAAQDPWPPFVTSEAPHGLSIELVSAALETQGYQLEFQIMPWARALAEVQAGNIDLLPATWFTEQRTSVLAYSDHYLYNQIKFITLPTNAFEYSGLDSLAGKRVGTVRGYGYGDDFLNSTLFNRSEANDLISNLRRLEAGRIDVTLEDELVARSLMSDNGLDANNYRFTTSGLSANSLHVTSGLANPNALEYIEAFNRGLEQIKANGTFDKILLKYGIALD
ncbi:transporter substrate-binding domain-containing protein [Vibrio metschnikovii]|uniref:transporter substrate-binding domain-containing protein n=1 Tax=Vibrio metschnikovii TaxID=28172 RepID=UPI002974CDAF|nr:transporter substrate-binding domain-containing protein [Vibrio metschnikovii]